MSNTATQPTCLLWTRGTGTARKPLHLTIIVTGLLLSILPFLTGCGTGEQGNQSTAGSSATATASLTWDPVTDPSVSAYFVHYGRQSPGQEGSCTYESSISVDSSSATITDLAPNTLYHFTVSAYNGLESACSNEVSIVTSPAPAPGTFS
jgi:Fibronectin type III domain